MSRSCFTTSPFPFPHLPLSNIPPSYFPAFHVPPFHVLPFPHSDVPPSHLPHTPLHPIPSVVSVMLARGWKGLVGAARSLDVHGCTRAVSVHDSKAPSPFLPFRFSLFCARRLTRSRSFMCTIIQRWSACGGSASSGWLGDSVSGAQFVCM